MATKSFPWNSEPAMLLGCGIDSEKICRFETTARESGHPYPFIFSKAELNHSRSTGNPAKALCAAFCCKEALRKAISAPYNFTDCEAFFDEESHSVSLHVAEGLKSEACIGEIRADVEPNPHDADELIVVVSVSGTSPSRTKRPDLKKNVQGPF
jgi:phosphopantetheinyl transferase (holo-ACP synthase)